MRRPQRDGAFAAIAPFAAPASSINFTGLPGSTARGFRAHFFFVGAAGADRDMNLIINGLATNIKRLSTTTNVVGPAVGAIVAANNYISTVRVNGRGIVEVSIPFVRTGFVRLIHVKWTTFRAPASSDIEFSGFASMLYNDTATPITQIGIETGAGDAPAAGSEAAIYLL